MNAAPPGALRSVTFEVVGQPRPQGSMRAVTNRHTGRVHLLSDNPSLGEWRLQIGLAARKAARWCSDAPVEVEAEFRLLRPRSLPRRVTVPDVPPDCDKLLRALLDGITKVLITDDGRVIRAVTSKRFCDADEQPGVRVRLREVGEPRKRRRVS